MIISRLLTDNLSDAKDGVRDLANARLVDSKRKTCQWTGAKTFHGAISALLSPDISSEFPGLFIAVTVWRNKPSGGITLLPSYGGTSNFGGLGPSHEPDFFDVVQTQAELPDGAIRLIRRELSDHCTVG